jgi:hypothetical protein
MVPTPGMDLQLETFLEKEQKRSKCAYVIPTYEISHRTYHLPTNKKELLELLKRKQARQFHQTLYPINQNSSNLNHWERIPQAKHTDIACKVKTYIYEPLYIARADTQEFDERFVGFWLTRNNQLFGLTKNTQVFGLTRNTQVFGLTRNTQIFGLTRNTQVLWANKEYSGALRSQGILRYFGLTRNTQLLWADKEHSGIWAKMEYSGTLG